MANSRGKHAQAISDRSGMAFPYNEMVKEWNGMLVHISEFEQKHPQLQPKPHAGDAQALKDAKPDRTENDTARLLPHDPFTTYGSGSGIINVYSPDHGLTNGTTYRFRGSPALNTGGGGTFQYNNPADFDGITGANIAKAAGYAITTGIFRDGARVSTDYAVANFFFFTVDTDTATVGGIKGGGPGCSVGPVTLSA